MQVRLYAVELYNFKNVCFGRIKMPSSIAPTIDNAGADILGIYGQNGSGKTAVTDALSLVRRLLCTDALPPYAKDYITKSEKRATVVCTFLMTDNSRKLHVEYVFELGSDTEFPLCGESLTIYDCTEDRKKRIGGVEYSVSKGLAFYPKKLWSITKAALIDAEVEKRLCMHDMRSILFSDKIFSLYFADRELYADIFKSLFDFAKTSFYIIRADSYTKEDAHIELVLPKESPSASCDIKLKEPTVIPLEDYDGFLSVLKSMNNVMSIIIPDLNIEIHEFGKEMLRDGRAGMRFELMSRRHNMSVPIRYESEGIKKIISVINLLIAMYNEEQMCIVIDELDSGVFEFLLGELLSCIEESGKGQLIFTSHNLRPLEMIASEALVFTTTNPNNRYIRIKDTSHNLRNTYIRSITLGGLKESIYDDVDTAQIAQAFRKCRGKEHEE